MVNIRVFYFRRQKGKNWPRKCEPSPFGNSLKTTMQGFRTYSVLFIILVLDLYDFGRGWKLYLPARMTLRKVSKTHLAKMYVHTKM